MKHKNDSVLATYTSQVVDPEALKKLQIENLLERDAAFSELLRLGAPYDLAHSHLIRWCNSYERLPEIMLLRGHMRVLDWWRLLGEHWTSCDNIGVYLEPLRKLLLAASTDHRNAMMSRYERKMLKNRLPRWLAIYRGCYEINSKGLCWTLSEGIAARFPLLNRYRRDGDAPILICGVVDSRMVVLKTDRKEQEVICPRVQVISRKSIET